MKNRFRVVAAVLLVHLAGRTVAAPAYQPAHYDLSALPAYALSYGDGEAAVRAVGRLLAVDA